MVTHQIDKNGTVYLPHKFYGEMSVDLFPNTQKALICKGVILKPIEIT